MQTATLPTTYDFLSGGGEMGKLIRSIDWSKTSVGPVDEWPQSLRTAISIMLNAQFPMYIAWGESFIQFYNDGYRPILGSTKHPAAMGLSTTVTFSEIWNIIGPMFEGVMDGKAVGFTDFLLPLDRHGFTEECYFIFSYSPIKQENGLTGGVLVTVTETTERLLGERRLKTLRNLGDLSSKTKSIQEASSCILEALNASRHDIPFSLLYLYDAAKGAFRFEGSTGVVTSVPDLDRVARLAGSHPFATVPLDELFETISFKDDMPWPELPKACCGTLLARPDQKTPFGLLVLGISARLRYDHHYGNFFRLLTDQAVTALSNAYAFEEERRRAEALAEIDRAKTAFFSNISHEFRTPLTLMLGPLEELLQSGSNMDGHQLENIDTAHRNAIRLLRLVNSLLDFSRIEAGRMEAVFRPVDLVSFTVDLASNFRSVVEKAGLQLTIECGTISDAVYVDYGMWEKIVLNLLSNAFKYTLNGSITVILEDAGNQVHLKVKDTGVGIPPKELPHMFERFHRISNSAGRTHEGTGIGLSLVCELVKLHKGEISVESRLGEGSTFTVSLPKGSSHLPADKLVREPEPLHNSIITDSYLKEVTALSPEAQESSWYSAPAEGAVTKGARVVIVDDNADMLNYLTRILGNYYHVTTAPHGLAALELLKHAVPDLVISDIMMPVMDGVELMKHIKGNPDIANVPVMLLSARAGEEAKIKGYDLGADDYLVKPFSAKELLARVRSQIQLARTRSHLSKLLKNVFEQTPAAITIIRKENYTVEFANDLYLELVDKGGDFVGRSLFESLPELRTQGIRELLDGVMTTGVPYRGEELPVYLNRQGRRERTFFNFMYHPLREESGEITGVIVVCFEVTDLVIARNRAEESETLLEAKVVERTAELESKNDELKKQNDFTEAILNASVDIVSVLDQELRYIMVDRKFEQLYHVPREQALGRHVLDVFPEVRGSVFYDLVTQAARGEYGYRKDYRSQITGRFYELFAIPLMRRNEVYAIVAIAHDNTDLMEAARHLEEKNNQLLKINEDLEQFAYVASHDLQEPLRKIRTFSSLLEKDFSPDPKAVKYFEKIHSSSERMSRLIKDLLNFSRLSNPRVDFVDVDLDDIMQSVVSDFELMIEEKSAQISYPALPSVSGVPVQLHQLFSNLVSNALKFTDRSPVIRMTCRVISAREFEKHRERAYYPHYAELMLEDNGIGFDPKFSDQIFTIFQRLHDKETSGTGIGLALCRKIAANHRGLIRAESKPGEGSRFFVYLPVIGHR